VRILVVEDQPRLSEQLADALADAGYAVDRAVDGKRADFLVETERYDAVLLDLGLPKIDGLTLLRKWRENGHTVPVLVLTARGSWHEKVQGIDSGADDYVAKPFRMEELLARLRALIRRGQQPLVAERVSVGGLTLDTRSHRAWIDEREVVLTAKEYALLEFLARRPGAVVSRADIAEHVWDEHYDPLSNVVDVYIQRLRRKLDRTGEASIIRTRRGEGYQLSMGGGVS